MRKNNFAIQSMKAFQFTGKLEPRGRGYVCLDIPRAVSEQIGQRGRVPVMATVNGHEVRTSIFPNGDGYHFMLVNKAMRQGAKAAVGDLVTVELSVDNAPRKVIVPPDFKQALAKSKKAQARFDAYPYSHQKEYLGYIEEAKRPETRAKRIAQTVAFLAQQPAPKKRAGA